jgi:hypothetical protein
MWSGRNVYNILVTKSEESHVSDLLLGVVGRVLLQCMLNKYNVKMWTAFMFRIGFSGCLLCMQQ